MQKQYEALDLEIFWVTEDVVRCSFVPVDPDANSGTGSGNGFAEDIGEDLFG